MTTTTTRPRLGPSTARAEGEAQRLATRRGLVRVRLAGWRVAHSAVADPDPAHRGGWSWTLDNGAEVIRMSVLRYPAGWVVEAEQALPGGEVASCRTPWDGTEPLLDALNRALGRPTNGS